MTFHSPLRGRSIGEVPGSTLLNCLAPLSLTLPRKVGGKNTIISAAAAPAAPARSH